MPEQQPRQAANYRYFVHRTPGGAVALIRRHINLDQDMWAPAGVLTDLQLEPEPRWIPNAWPPAELLDDKEMFAEIEEAEAERMTRSIQSSATLYLRPVESREPTLSVSAQAIASGAEFEEHARHVLSEAWGLSLSSRVLTLRGDVTHSFDLVSDDGTVVGDAKWYKDLRPIPAAKLSVIAEYVWLLQNLESAQRRFLVFGQDRVVPERWLSRFRPLLGGVEFWFLDDRLDQLA